MGRLVDTDVLVKIIDKHTNDDNQLDNDITCILEEVPTAYDVEKVVEQLKDASVGTSGVAIITLPTIIEIIRNGGV